jgi:hypothetical protein
MGNLLVSDRFRRSLVGSVAVLASLFWAGSAAAQDYDAGKTGPQLFASDCSACHKGPGGLAKGRDKGGLTSFLKEHYTSKQESAALLAAYLLGAGPGDARIKADAPMGEGGGPAGPKPKNRKAEREGDKTGPKGEPKAEPQTHAATEPAAQPDADDAHEEAAPKDAPKRSPRAAERDGAKGEKADKGPGDTVLSKLRFYGAAGGEAKDTVRSSNPVRRLESYANSGSDSVAPTSATTHDDAAPTTKRKPAEKKKKDDTSASATPEQHGPRPPKQPAPSPQTTGNN